MGINGVDNGIVQFINLRIPRVNMLNRFADVSEAGVYSCKFADEGKHFGATLGELSGGRVSFTCLCRFLLGLIHVRHRYSSALVLRQLPSSA